MFCSNLWKIYGNLEKNYFVCFYIHYYEIQERLWVISGTRDVVMLHVGGDGRLWHYHKYKTLLLHCLKFKYTITSVRFCAINIPKFIMNTYCNVCLVTTDSFNVFPGICRWDHFTPDTVNALHEHHSNAASYLLKG